MINIRCHGVRLKFGTLSISLWASRAISFASEAVVASCLTVGGEKYSKDSIFFALSRSLSSVIPCVSSGLAWRWDIVGSIAKLTFVKSMVEV